MNRRERLARAYLYLVLEARPHGRTLRSLLDAALRGGVDILQLRDTANDSEELLTAAAEFRRACDQHGALFMVNDRPDLCLEASADGVHVGQRDASLDDVRQTIGTDLLVGVSASSPDQIVASSGADYIGVGTVFATPTKPGGDIGGLPLVRDAARLATRPWFAIGGIDLCTIRDVVEAGATRVAVVRAIRDASDPEAAARALRAALRVAGAHSSYNP